MKIDRLAVARARAARGGGVWRRAGRRPSIVRPNDATYAGASFGRRTHARCIGNMIARERARRDPRENVPRARRRRNCRLARGPLEGLFGGVRAPTRVARIPKSRDATRNARESVCARVCQRARQRRGAWRASGVASRARLSACAAFHCARISLSRRREDGNHRRSVDRAVSRPSRWPERRHTTSASVRRRRWGPSAPPFSRFPARRALPTGLLARCSYERVGKYHILRPVCVLRVRRARR